MAANLFEAAETVGVPRDELVAPLGLDAVALTDPRTGIAWDTLVLVLQELSKVLGGDVDALRQIGRAMVHVPSYMIFQRVGRAVISLENLYVVGERWIAPANVPHLVLRTTFPAQNRLNFRCTIPEPYAASTPYFHVFEGLLCALPTLLGLPTATILASTVTPRDLDIDLALPPSRSVAARLRRVGRAAFHHEDAIELLEAQRREIAAGLEAAKFATAEIVTLFDRLPNLVVIHRGGRVAWANRAAIRTLGYETTADIGLLPFRTLFHPSAHELADELSDGKIGDADALELVEAELVARDGSRVGVEVSPTQAVTFGGSPARLFVAHNVTERRRLQQQLSISDRLASVGMLAAGVAHEVNNPLAYVLNNIEIARRELGPLGDRAERSQLALNVALEGVDRIRTIIRELLTLARVDDDTIGAVDVGDIVESTLALALPHISERARLVRDLAPAPRVRGTPSRIGQVLLNLVSNALEAMPTAARDTNVLRISVAPSRLGGAVLEVADTGVGIADAHVGQVFEPFFTTKSAGKGTGLGLAISQRLAMEIGGVLTFESTPGVGTTFRLTLAPPIS